MVLHALEIHSLELHSLEVHSLEVHSLEIRSLELLPREVQSLEFPAHWLRLRRQQDQPHTRATCAARQLVLSTSTIPRTHAVHLHFWRAIRQRRSSFFVMGMSGGAMTSRNILAVDRSQPSLFARPSGSGAFFLCFAAAP